MYKNNCSIFRKLVVFIYDAMPPLYFKQQNLKYNERIITREKGERERECATIKNKKLSRNWPEGRRRIERYGQFV